MNQVAALLAELRNLPTLYQELLTLIEREGQAIRAPLATDLAELRQLKQRLLERLNQSLDILRSFRLDWESLTPAERAGLPELRPWFRQSQDLIMKALVLDRENEQALLRRGLVPARHLPPVQRQRPHFVTDLYRRHGPS